MNDDVLTAQPEPAANSEIVWAFDLGKGSLGEAVRRGNEFLHQASLLIPAEFAETKTAVGRRQRWRTRQAQDPYRPSPAGGGRLVAQASAPAGDGSVSLPVHGRATTRGGTPLELAAETATLPALPGGLTAVAPKRRYVAARRRKFLSGF